MNELCMCCVVYICINECYVNALCMYVCLVENTGFPEKEREREPTTKQRPAGRLRK